MEKFLDMKPMNDVAYSFNHGASVRKQWKDLVLSGRSWLLSFMVSFNPLLQDHTSPCHILV